MKYEEIYKKTNTKNEFVNVAMKKFPDIKKETAVRRYYDVRKKIKTPKTVIIEPIEISNVEYIKPDYLKMLVINDMKRLKIKITKEILKKHGFKNEEINWLIKNEMV